MTVLAAPDPTRSTRSTTWVPFALVALVLIPAIAGCFGSSSSRVVRA